MTIYFVELHVDELLASKPDFFGVPWAPTDKDELPSAIIVQCTAIETRGSWISFLDQGLVLCLPAHLVCCVMQVIDAADHDQYEWICRECGFEFDSIDKTDTGCPNCTSYRLVKLG